MNNPRVYKNSPFVFGMLLVMFVVLLVAFFFAAGDDDFSNPIVMILFALVFGFLFIFLVFNATSQTIVSDDEVSTKNLLGTKSLRWNEISRVSGRGYAIKLHNSDGDITVAPNPQLPGYEDVVERIGMKHPNLFDPQEYGEMSKSWTGVITLPLVGILFIGFGLFIFTQADNIFFPLLMLSVIGIVFIGTPLTSPQAVTIQGDSITIGYLFRQKTLLAKEITSIDLRYTQTRNGKNYFVVVTPVSGGAIRLSGLRPNLPVTFLVLRNWHGKNTQIGQTNQQN